MNCQNKECEAYNEDYCGNCGDDWIKDVSDCPDAWLQDEEDSE